MKNILAFAIIGLFLVSFQNCSKLEAIGELVTSVDLPSSSGPVTAARIPASDKIDVNGMSNAAYDACIFYKNPVAQEGSAAGAWSYATLSNRQNFCVKLEGATAGLLSNSSITIDVKNSTLVSSTANLRQPIAEASSSSVEQVMSYYWGNRVIQYMQARTGVNYLSGKELKVINDDTFTGWNPKKNQIHLTKKASGESDALSAEILVSLIGQAQLFHASGGASETGGATSHSSCDLNQKGCCSSTFGCSRAIAFGVGEYLAAVMFPDKMGFGETKSDSTTGINKCSISRNLASASALTAQQAFDACGAGYGNVQTMGSLYASFWWELRQAADEKEVDILFMEHLKLINGDDTFSEAGAKIIQLDAQLFNSKHVSSIQAILAQKGI